MIIWVHLLDLAAFGQTGMKSAKFKWYDIVIGAVATAVMIGLIVLVSLYIHRISDIRWMQGFGYAGLFIIGLITGSVAFIPIPGLILVFAMGSVLFPPLVGLVSGFGEAVGSILIYLFGYGGHAVMYRVPDRYTNMFERWLQKHGWLAVIFVSGVINPFFMSFAAMAGMMRFGLLKFFILCFVGKSTKNITVAYLGYFGLGAILRAIGIPI